MKNTLTKISSKVILIGILSLVVVSFSGCDSSQQKTEIEQPKEVKPKLSTQQVIDARQNYEVVVNDWLSTGWESRYNPNTEKTESSDWTKLDLLVKNNNPDIFLDVLTIRVNIKHVAGSDGEDTSWGRLSVDVSDIKPGKSKTMIVYYPGDLSRVVAMQDVYTTIESTIPENSYRFFKELK